MLYDKRWDSTPATKPADPFTLPALIAWLETMPGDETYCYLDTGYCMFGQYFRAIGFERVTVLGSSVVLDGVAYPFSPAFKYIPPSMPHTFGAALTRARQALADQVFCALADTSRETV